MSSAIISPFPKSQTIRVLVAALLEADEFLESQRIEAAETITVLRLKEFEATEKVRQAEAARQAIIEGLRDAQAMEGK